MVVQFLDRVTEPRHRNKLSEYVFGYTDIEFGNFERTLIASLVGFFMRDGRLRYRRVLAFSMSYVIIVDVALALVTAAEAPQMPAFTSMAMAVAATAIPFGIMNSLFDYWSIFVTKKLFVDSERFRWPWTIPGALIVVVLSFLPAAALIGIAWLVSGGTAFTDDPSTTDFAPYMVFSGAALIAAVTSVFLIVIQVIVLGLGLLLRTITRLTVVTQWLSAHSQVHEYPFTFLWLCLSPVLALATRFSG